MTEPTPGPGRNPITASEFDQGGAAVQPEPRCGNCRFLVADHRTLPGILRWIQKKLL